LSRKILIALIVLVLILMVGGGAYLAQKMIIIGKEEQSRYIQSDELKNKIVSSRESLEEGFKLLFDKEPNLEGIKLVPNLSIKFKEEMYFYGYIMDKHNNIISKARTYPSLIENGREVLFYWDTAKEALNGEYYFYVELYKGGDKQTLELVKTAPIRSKPIIINISGNDLPEGFYIYSPPIISMLTGLNACISYEEKPSIAWIDTTNKKVEKYQIFAANPTLNPEVKPIVDEISASVRSVQINKKLLKPMKKEEGGRGPIGFNSFIVRAILKDGSYKDTNESGPIEFMDKGDIPEIFLQ